MNLSKQAYCVLAAAVAALIISVVPAQAAEFLPLGPETFVRAISGDGSFAVGSRYRSNSEPMRWIISGEPMNLGGFPDRFDPEEMSFDGSVVVGQDDGAGTSCCEASRWTEAGGLQGLSTLPGHTGSFAWDVSADGSIVVGMSWPSDGPYEAFLWADGIGMIGLGTLPGHLVSEARGVSADGSVVVGESRFDNSGSRLYEAFRWTEGGGMQGLGVLFGSTLGSSATGISADGLTIVGGSDSTQGWQAFRWTEGSGMIGLGDLPGGEFDSLAVAASDDGSVIVGQSRTSFAFPLHEAFIWGETNGMRRLEDVLTDAGLDLTGWQLTLASGISDDGNVIGGFGINPLGQEEAWIARLASTTNPDFNGDGALNCTDIDALVAEIVAGAHGAQFDLTGDGLVDNSDLDEWRAQGGAANLPSGNPYLVGDATLDGSVDGLDFIRWNDNKFTSVAAWCSGDFTADGTVDGQDFALWNDNKFMSSDVISAVPEPGIGVLLIAALISLGVAGRRWPKRSQGVITRR